MVKTEIEVVESQGCLSRIWRNFEDFIWMNNHQFFYVCAIHEYCTNNILLRAMKCSCFGKSQQNDVVLNEFAYVQSKFDASQVIRMRLILFLIMSGLIVSEIIVERKPRVLYLTNWGVWLVFVISIL